MKRIVVVISFILLLSLVLNFWIFISYENSVQDRNELEKEYSEIADENSDYKKFQNDILHYAEVNHTAVTIIYYTDNGRNRQVISFSVPYEKYDAYQKKNHPYWGELNLTSAVDYITYSETIINQIVETVENQTQSQEELANALLNFVQDKGYALSIRYYPTTELKFPIETLVETGGDCDTHSILYGTLMKAAGFKVLLLFSNEKVDGQPHVAIAIHLDNPPTNSLPQIEDKDFTYNEEKYYYAETTNADWRAGDLPPKFQNLTFQIMPL